MAFAPLSQYFKKEAAEETRSIFVGEGGSLPPGGYFFVELYCEDSTCDCRRAFIQVYSNRVTPGVPLATISFGWEDEAFYRGWARFPITDGDLRELMGPSLATHAPQSAYAEALLAELEGLLREPGYRGQIVRHYRMVRGVVEGGAG